LEPHLSGTVIIAATGIIIIFAGGANFFHLLLIFATGICGGAAFIMTKPYAMDRIRVWLNPFLDPLDKGWQGVQSLLAIGSGGLWGLGLGQSRQKNLYLPEPANDFIFSVVCEELGFIGAMLIITAFAAMIIRGYWIAVHARDRFGVLLAVGITSQIAIQTVFNICVISGLMPVTGASLPFFSYGGTSLLIQLAEVGVLLSISRQISAPKLG
ncbi:MAG: FtsW/RodA/SpoVE family cell cycle protein, partial [Bacillota bacterium]|nr:FtsW/RodA/SpoVE family cell cycle protein [Bacillota bacterium]